MSNIFQGMKSSSSSSNDDTIVQSIVSVAVVAEPGQRKWSGKSLGCRSNIPRGSCGCYLYYLSENPVYPASHFRRRFGIPLSLYRKLEHDLPLIEPNLTQKVDAAGKLGVTVWQKILGSLRRLSDGCSYSSLDDQSRMSVESMRHAFNDFFKAVKTCYGDTYLNRIPTEEELQSL